MAEPILDYDTDAISITSSVSSTKTETYNVNAILSETLTYDSDGERDKKFLIEWDGYPLYR
jgi:chromo domain-containing protein 1